MRFQIGDIIAITTERVTKNTTKPNYCIYVVTETMRLSAITMTRILFHDRMMCIRLSNGERKDYSQENSPSHDKFLIARSSVSVENWENFCESKYEELFRQRSKEKS